MKLIKSAKTKPVVADCFIEEVYSIYESKADSTRALNKKKKKKEQSICQN